MKIEIGKFYKTRHGKKAVIYESDCDSLYGAVRVNSYPTWESYSWHLGGTQYMDKDHKHEDDLVSEWGKDNGTQIELKSSTDRLTTMLHQLSDALTNSHESYIKLEEDYKGLALELVLIQQDKEALSKRLKNLESK